MGPEGLEPKYYSDSNCLKFGTSNVKKKLGGKLRDWLLTTACSAGHKSCMIKKTPSVNTCNLHHSLTQLMNTIHKQCALLYGQYIYTHTHTYGQYARVYGQYTPIYRQYAHTHKQYEPTYGQYTPTDSMRTCINSTHPAAQQCIPKDLNHQLMLQAAKKPVYVPALAS